MVEKNTNEQDKIFLRSFGSHRRIFPDGDSAQAGFIEGELLGELLDRLAVPEEEIWIVTVNGKAADRSYLLSPGDKVDIMCPVLGG